MPIELTLYRWLHLRKWAALLGVCRGRMGRRAYRALDRMMQDAVDRLCLEIRQCADEINHGQPVTERMDALLLQIIDFTPFATPEQNDALRLASIAGLDAKRGRAAQDGYGCTYYSVRIPAMKSDYFYLSLTDYRPGDLVTVPFGPEDTPTLGIVQSSAFYPMNELPHPLFAMKYISHPAPPEIAKAYQKERNT